MKWFLYFSAWLLASGALWADGGGVDVGGDHWSFQRPERSDLHGLATERANTRLDVLVQQRLREQSLPGAERADPATRLRRLYLVLTGLLPDLDFQRAFLNDTSPNREGRFLDRLLGSYAFGERMASFWLPIARYAEDQAHQVGDNASLTYPNAHRYRQWVIDAFNRDVPYDSFIEWQLAADFYEDVRDRETDALGFLGIGPKYYNRRRLEVMADEWEDRVDTVTRSFLGLTVACARCHDHKYDPISTEDYHALAGVFASTDMLNKRLPGTPESDKDAKKGDVAPKHAQHIVKDGNVQDLPVYIRGDVSKPGAIVPRRFLQVLSDGTPKSFTNGSGRRELAEAITDPSNPLTARVMANRLWGEVFGKPLVTTTSNFGALGEKPSHQAMLDDLAVDFAGHLSVKKLVREMVMSATFQQSSTLSDISLLERDPGNRWWGRMPRRRLGLQMWRDSVLASSGDLDPRGGASLEIEDATNTRRTVYARISRLDLNDVLEQFDYPDPNIHAGGQSVTTTTTQKLYLLNHPFVLAQAERLAERVARSASGTAEQVRLLYQLLYTRVASASELAKGMTFLQAGDAATPRLTKYAQVLLCSNEMLYLD